MDVIVRGSQDRDDKVQTYSRVSRPMPTSSCKSVIGTLPIKFWGSPSRRPLKTRSTTPDVDSTVATKPELSAVLTCKLVMTNRPDAMALSFRSLTYGFVGTYTPGVTEPTHKPVADG